MKALPLILGAAVSATASLGIFATSFWEYSSIELASPTSTQPVHVIHELPLPLKILLRSVGSVGAIAAGACAGYGLSKMGRSVYPSRQGVPALPPGVAPPISLPEPPLAFPNPVAERVMPPRNAPSPLGSALPSPVDAISHRCPSPPLPPPATPTPRPQPSPPPLRDLLAEAASTDLHLALVTKSGAGKSTSLKYLLYLILQKDPSVQIRILDPKTTDWLGLQRLPGIVSYLGICPKTQRTQTLSEQVQSICEVFEEVYEVLSERKVAVQIARLNGGSVPSFPHYYFVLDEWLSVLRKMEDSGAQKRPLTVLNELLTQGRELGVHIIIAAHSHNCGEIGISRPVRRCLTFLVQGRMGPNRDVGYEPLHSLAQDDNMFSSKGERDANESAVHGAIRASQKEGLDRPVLLTTLPARDGVPAVGLVPDLTWIAGVSLSPKNAQPQSSKEESLEEQFRRISREVGLSSEDPET